MGLEWSKTRYFVLVAFPIWFERLFIILSHQMSLRMEQLLAVSNKQWPKTKSHVFLIIKRGRASLLNQKPIFKISFGSYTYGCDVC